MGRAVPIGVDWACLVMGKGEKKAMMVADRERKKLKGLKRLTDMPYMLDGSSHLLVSNPT